MAVTVGLLGLAMPAALSQNGAGSATSSSARPAAIWAGPDVLAELDNEEREAVLAVTVDQQQARFSTRQGRIDWLRQRWIKRWSDRRAGKPEITRGKPGSPLPDTTSTKPPATIAPTTTTVRATTSSAPTITSQATTSSTTESPATTAPTTSTTVRVTTSAAPPSTPSTPPTNTAPATTAVSPVATTSTPPSSVPSQPRSESVFRFTLGSGNSTEFDSSSQPEGVSAHGTRIYCVTSHFSYDDPVVFPGRTGAAHAHMFWGNTDADAFSTGQSLMSSGNSSCEGGTANRSSYWMPVMFNELNEATVPESIFVYYKSFGGPAFDRSTIQPIPAGLEMLATRQVRGAGDWDFQAVRSAAGTELKIAFPECLAVDRSGQPILSSTDNVSHLSYATENSAPSGCPSSHPYRIPTVSYIVNFAVPFDSDWYLASDDSTATKGQSLHADYIAAWDPGTMDEVVECTVMARKSCEFPGRGQLPERFLAPDGTLLYRYSVQLLPTTDRTPFGTRINKTSR